MQDPVADMLTRIRNAQSVGEREIEMPSSTLKVAILKVLGDEGYIQGYEAVTTAGKTTVKVSLKYYQNKPVIAKITRVSRPGLRIYRRTDQLPTVLAGMGIAIISTPKGLMTEKTARANKLGGEVICTVE